MSRPWVRPTARVVVLDPAGRVLLLGARLTAPDRPPGDVLFWYTPGGGVEDGETVRQAAVRELAQEIGLVVDGDRLEGPVWLRRHVGEFGGVPIDSRETFFVLREVVHTVDDSGRTALERFGAEPHRWWSRAEIVAATAAGTRFAPGDLAHALAQLARGPQVGPPHFIS